MTVQSPTDPRFGSKLSASEFRNRVTNPLVANDTSIDARVAALENLVAGLPQDYRQSSIPTAAKFRDRWIDSSDNDQQYFCIETYGDADADKIHKWVAIGDSSARTTAQNALSTAGLASRVIIDSVVPSACERGWTWTDTATSNRDMRCLASYGATDGPDGYDSIDSYRRSRFAPTDSHIGGLLAAAEQGLRDGKTNTYFQPDVPDEADGRDIWVDTDNNNGSFACFAAYTATDHDPYDSLKDYVEGEIATYLGNMYQVKIGGSAAGNLPTDTLYWTLLGTAYANQTLFRESRWTPVSDAVARSLAQAAQGIADGKTSNFYQANYPEEADYKDTFVNSTTKQSYICIQSYNAGTVELADRPLQWEPIADTIAREAAEAGGAISDGVIGTYLQPTLPTSAGIKDLWFDSSKNYQAYVCIAEYTTGGDLSFWKALTDGSKTSTYQTPSMPDQANLGDSWVKNNEEQFVCIQTYPNGSGILGVNWQAVANTFRAVYYLPDPPVSARQGDGWLDTYTPSGQYQFYICSESYTSNAHGWVSLDTPGKWTPSRDVGAQTTATLALDVANGKTTTYYQDGLPDSAKKGDTWVDTNDTYLDTGLNKTYICISGYSSGGGNPTNWTEYADPVAMATAQQALSIADGKRKIIYASSVPDALDYGGFDIGDGWMDADDGKFYICKTAHLSGINFTYWRESTSSTAEQAYQIALDSRAVQDGIRQTFTTSGPGDTYWPGPGSANQWAVSNWVSTGTKVGDIWLHKNTTTSTDIIRFCNTAYSGYADGDVGNLGYWTAFTDEGILADVASKMDKTGGTFTGGVTFSSTVVFAAAQTFNGSSMSLSGGATVAGALTVNTAPTGSNHVVRKTELDAEASTRASAISAETSARTTAISGETTARNAAISAETATRIAEIAKIATQVKFYYSSTGSGDLSGSDASNRALFGRIGFDLEDYDNLCLDLSSDTLSEPLGIANKNIKITGTNINISGSINLTSSNIIIEGLLINITGTITSQSSNIYLSSDDISLSYLIIYSSSLFRESGPAASPMQVARIAGHASSFYIKRGIDFNIFNNGFSYLRSCSISTSVSATAQSSIYINNFNVSPSSGGNMVFSSCNIYSNIDPKGAEFYCCQINGSITEQDSSSDCIFKGCNIVSPSIVGDLNATGSFIFNSCSITASTISNAIFLACNIECQDLEYTDSTVFGTYYAMDSCILKAVNVTLNLTVYSVNWSFTRGRIGTITWGGSVGQLILRHMTDCFYDTSTGQASRFLVQSSSALAN